ncbi:hypothetical protein DES53_101505 [Roseimicrobium gellanilyticum]|uniref:Uncharacterized protein n=1 Tax=Roseimicrobium gellanilyticum TaxID=748857 RepID=A0A366HTU5_9BACT|nr:hypothetical protein [Roseimicrobium gellanilyticum]RBP47706.1 hypothetical protein DES53_101505 [Roseimicrobium gellanilyticum]
MEPFLWLGAFALCVALHLVVHPQARLFRDALAWLGRHPAPFLWLMASLMVHEAWSLRTGDPPPPVMAHALSPWPDVFFDLAARGWQRFAMLFHQAIYPPPFLAGTVPGAILMGLFSAAGQMWLCCYFIASRESLLSDAALRPALARWRTILVLAVIHAAWWWMAERTDATTRTVREWLMPQFLVFLAPLPLAAAAARVDFLKAGAVATRWWGRAWLPMLMFALTAVPLLVLLEFALHVLPSVLPPARMVTRLLVASILEASLHSWLFVSAALLLLRGGYLDKEPSHV